MKISALFLTLAAAQDGDAMASQGAASQGAASQGAQGAQTGRYGAQQGEQAESYGEEAAPQQTYAAAPAETYAAAPVETYAAAPVAHAAPKVCFQGCPAESPCYGNGGCQPSSCGGHTHYAEEQHESYAESPVASSAGYRRLADYGEQGEAQQSYGEAAPVAYAAPQEACGCPPGTVDTAHLALSSPLILWIAFALLFIPAMFFVCRGNDGMQSVLGATTIPTYQQYKDLHQLSQIPSLTSTNNADFMISLAAGDAAEAIFDTILLPRIFAGMICTIAALAYLTMATGHGYIVKCNGRAFYYARYVDWAITTPLLLFDIAQIAGFGSTISQSFLVAMDILMIAAGLIGELVDGSVRWAFFGFGMLFSVPILMWLCIRDSSDGVCCGANSADIPAVQLSQRLIFLTWFTWMFYPIVWVLANTGGTKADQGGYRSLQGTGGFVAVGVISVTAEAFIYTVLDVLAKTFFGAVIVCHNWGEDFTWVCDWDEECCGQVCCDTLHGHSNIGRVGWKNRAEKLAGAIVAPSTTNSML